MLGRILPLRIGVCTLRQSTNRKPTPKEAKKLPKKTLQEECETRLNTIRTDEFERRAAVKREAHRSEEDEMMLLVYGPNWRQSA